MDRNAFDIIAVGTAGSPAFGCRQQRLQAGIETTRIRPFPADLRPEGDLRLRIWEPAA